jgi:hypothetical protein
MEDDDDEEDLTEEEIEKIYLRMKPFVEWLMKNDELFIELKKKLLKTN